MKVYHGSDVRIETVDLSRSKDFRDFGRGFYVTPNRNHASRWAIRIAEGNNTEPVVTEFEFHNVNLERRGLKVKRFDGASEEWVKFVVLNRSEDNLPFVHGYDIVEGPIANDWVTSQIRNYKKGKITIDNLLQRLLFREETCQICFCTPESLFTLEQTGFDHIYNTEEITNAVIEAIITEYLIDEKTAFDKFYFTDVFSLLSNVDTGYYLKPWQEIYEMVKKELEQKNYM